MMHLHPFFVVYILMCKTALYLHLHWYILYILCFASLGYIGELKKSDTMTIKATICYQSINEGSKAP